MRLPWASAPSTARSRSSESAFTCAGSLTDARLIITFSAAPRSAASARSAPTPMSLTVAVAARSTVRSHRSRSRRQVCATSSGTRDAASRAAWSRSVRACFSSAVAFGSFIASLTRAYAALSSSTSRTKSERRLSASAIIATVASLLSLRCAIRPTIAASAAPIAPAYAAALPPPGTAAADARSSLKARRVRSTSRSFMGSVSLRGLDDDGRAVREHLGDAAHHFGRVVAHRDDRVRAHVAGVRQQQLVGLLPRVLAELGEQRDVAAGQGLQRAAERADDAPRADRDAAHHAQVARDLVPRDVGARRDELARNGGRHLFLQRGSSRGAHATCYIRFSRFHPERLRERPDDASATGGAPLWCHFRPWTPRKDERGTWPLASLESLLHQGAFVLTAELNPPKSAAASVVRRRASVLKGVVDAVNVTDSNRANVAMAAIPAAVLA